MTFIVIKPEGHVESLSVVEQNRGPIYDSRLILGLQDL
jgi:hypothetical protein